MSQLGTYNVSVRINFDAGKGKNQTKKMNEGFSSLGKRVANVGRGFERMGRTISITGFVLGIVARRIIGSFEGIAKSIIKISEEGANLDRSFTFLSDTLQALALSGMLTDEMFNRVYGTFQDMMDIALRSAGPWAIINETIQQIKNAIALGALPSLVDFSDFLATFDLSSFNAALSEATNTFLTPIIAKIEELLGDEEGGVIGIKEKLNAIASIGGTFLSGVLQGFSDVATKAAELLGDNESGILGIAYALGEAGAWGLVAAPFAAIVGILIGGFGSVLSSVSSLIGLLGGGGAGAAGIAGLTLLATMALVISDFNDWKETLNDLATAINNLMTALGPDFARGLDYAIMDIDELNDALQTAVNLVTSLLNFITRAIEGWNTLMSLNPSQASRYVNYGTAMGQNKLTGWEDPFTSLGPALRDMNAVELWKAKRGLEEGGTLVQTNNINVNGAGDPARVADEVERRLSDKTRRAWMPL